MAELPGLFPQQCLILTESPNAEPVSSPARWYTAKKSRGESSGLE